MNFQVVEHQKEGKSVKKLENVENSSFMNIFQC
jgi:hypothetical protein